MLRGVLGLLCLMIGQWGLTQQPTGSDPFSRGGSGNSDLPLEQGDASEFVDTFGVFYFYGDNPSQEFAFSDSLLTNEYHQYDPVRRRDFEYMHLGTVGSAQMRQIYEPELHQGLDVGLHQYDLYLIRSTDLPFYRLEKPYTNLTYVQGSEQADGLLNAQFSRNFANGLNFSVDYNRLSQIGRSDQYPNQNRRNTNLATGMWYHSKNGKYDAFISYAANTFEQEDNGGVSAEPSVQGDLGTSPASALVFLEDGETRHTHREFNYTHYYKFGGDTDTLGRTSRAYTLNHQLIRLNSTYKFYDLYSDVDTTFFQWFPDFLVDLRGQRFFLRHQKLTNSFRISTYKLDRAKSDNEARRQRDLFEVGLTHHYHHLTQEAQDTILNDLIVTGKWNFSPSERIQLQTSGHLNLWNNAGDYRVQGKLLLDLKKAGTLKATFVNQLYSPDFLQAAFYLSQRKIWDNNFNRTLETSITASYRIPFLDMEVGGGYHLLNNFIYFDTLGLAQQTGVPISITQLTVRKDFEVGAFHLDNTFALQKASESTVRIPGIYGKHSLYYTGRWFKVLQVRLGVDLRYNDAYYAYYYNPVSGRFQLQDSQQIDFYPQLDAYFSMRIGKFRAFAKFDNLTTALNGNKLFYQTAYYPYPDGSLRIGINWRLVN